MSEVFIVDKKESLDSMVLNSTHVLVISGSAQKSEIFKEVKFPQATHHEKKHETLYREFFKTYNVIEILKSKNKIAGTIKIWDEPDYDESDARIEHEQGAITSPIVEKYKPTHPPEDKESKIVFLEELPNKDIYKMLGAEGMKSLDLVKTSLKNVIPPPKKSK